MQKFVLQEGDEGPYYLKHAHCRKFDKVKGVKKVKKEQADLMKELSAKNVGIRGKSINELKQLAYLHGILMEKEVEDIEEGWCRKTKGIRKILWERGLLDPNKKYFSSQT